MVIIDGNTLFISFHIIGCKDENIPLRQSNLFVFEGLDPVLRTLCVQHDGNRQFQFFPYLFNELVLCQMFLMRSMSKI